MSFISHGLRCVDSSCALTEPHVFYRRSLGPPPCPECGSEREISWAHGQFPGTKGDGYGSFTPMDMGIFGRVETREAYNRVMGVIKQRHPNAQIQVEPDSAAEQQQRADEARQRAHDRQSQNSLNKKMMKEIATEHKSVVAEASRNAVRHNLDPKQAATKAGKKCDSPAALATGGRIGQKGSKS